MDSVRIKHLSVNYVSGRGNVEALHDLSLDLSEGGIYAVIGPSGCGKSTLLHVLGGITTDYQGEVSINGQKPNPKKQSIGLIPQNYGLLPWKRVKDNIYLSSRIKRLPEDTGYNEEIIRTLELTDLLERYPNELSGGQRQRVAIARSFIQKPELLLMDEPFSALDTLTAEKCRNLFIEIWKRHKVTTLFITHNLEEAVQIGKHIIILGKAPGSLVETVENPLMQPGAERTSEACLRQAGQIRQLIKQEWA